MSGFFAAVVHSSVAKLLSIQRFLWIDFEAVESLFRMTEERYGVQKKSEALENLIEGEAKKTEVLVFILFKTSFYEELVERLLSDRRFTWILISFERSLSDWCPCNYVLHKASCIFLSARLSLLSVRKLQTVVKGACTCTACACSSPAK